MDFPTAIKWLESYVNLEGTSTVDDRPAAPALPTAGATEGLSLAPMRELLGFLGDPHHAYRTIHVTGTNGKGSTCRYTSALLQATGLSVGMYTSPNVEHINERIVWNGTQIGNDELALTLTLIRDLVPLMTEPPSRFELLTAVALTWFAEVGVEVAVVEVGLLGRFDATNVVDSDVAVLTNIGKDHTDGIGDWRLAVATEKAGIIKPASRVILGEPFGLLRSAIDAEPNEFVWEMDSEFQLTRNDLGLGGRVVTVTTPKGTYEDIFLPLFGEHQGNNLATALATVDAFFDRSLDRDLVEGALAEVELPGRFEVISREPTVVLDGGHNPEGIATAKKTLDQSFARIGSWILVMGLLTGKDIAEMLEAVDARDFDAVIACQPTWSRAVPAVELAAAAAAMGVQTEVVPDPVEAFLRAHAISGADDLILVAGSMYVVGAVRATARTRAVHSALDTD